jgi:hypothetical protein
MDGKIKVLLPKFVRSPHVGICTGGHKSASDRQHNEGPTGTDDKQDDPSEWVTPQCEPSIITNTYNNFLVSIDVLNVLNQTTMVYGLRTLLPDTCVWSVVSISTRCK